MVIIIRIDRDCNQFHQKYEKINMEDNEKIYDVSNNLLFRESVLKPIYYYINLKYMSLT